jgi:glycosyltransferase involved in cell wall biosynthesis
MKPLVSVIVPTYNRPDTLEECLESINRQTYSSLEVLVVNDGGQEVEEIISKFNKEGNIRYIRHSTNRGPAAAKNSGIRAARGKYIAYLDDDDIYYPDHVETLVEFLEKDHHLVAYTDAFRVILGMKNDGYAIEKKDVPYSFDFDRDRMLVSNYIPTLCMMHETSCLEKTGMFDEGLMAHEDWELWIRMSRVFEFRHICERTCEFRLRLNAASITSGRRREFLRTLILIHERYKELAEGKHHVGKEQKKTVKKQQILIKLWDIIDRISGVFGKRLTSLYKLKKYLI